MLIKVCGMRDSGNIQDVSVLKPDWMGFIFYPKSKRYVGNCFSANTLPSKKTGIKTVAVFVDESYEIVKETATSYKFDIVQLHGTETPEMCQQLRETGITVLKAFGISTNFNWQLLKPYETACDYFLFDTSTPDHGGSGQKFSWQLLENYNLSKPFVLSGGIGPTDASDVLQLRHPEFAGIDINSCFESKPAMKDVRLLTQFIHQIRS